MIKTFANEETERIFRGVRPHRLPAELWRRSARKLLLLNAAENLAELGVAPGNRLEKLKGDRAGQHSIRINDQWRVCFVWRDGNAYEVEIADYHS